MKKLLLLIAITVFSSALLTAQQVIVTDQPSHTEPSSGAVLDVFSNDRGFLPPRVALTAANAASPITSPSTGLIVYNTATAGTSPNNVTPGYYYNSGTTEAPVWAKLMINDLANGMSIQSDGSFILNGTATVWDDLRVPLSEPATGLLKPDWQMFPFGASGSNPYLNWFRATGVDEMYFVVQIPHDYAYNTDIEAHIHWVPSVNGGGTLETPTVPRWGLQYTWANIGTTFPTHTIIYGTSTIPNEVLIKDRHYLTPLGTISGADKTLSGMLVCRIFRDGDNSADNFAGLAGALEVDFHYQRNTMGSRSEYTK
jgi:hypothetical protein